jgi:hypothetical protein
MFSKETVQSYLNQHRKEWGRSDLGDRRDLWSTPPNSFTEADAILAGIRHSCMVIQNVSTKKTPYDMCLSYGGKNNFFQDISQFLNQNHRPDLVHSWNQKELKSRRHQIHPEVKAIAQFPEGYHKRTLSANSRMVQYYIPDHFKTLDQMGRDQSVYQVNLSDYSNCAVKARDLDHFCALIATQTASILKSRGLDNASIAKLLAQNFAQTGIVRENGQIKHAQHIVDSIIQEITSVGTLPGLSAEFRHLAQPKVRRYYQGTQNSRL